MALTVKAVQSKRHPGDRTSAIYHCDSDGLYLRITPSGGKSWAFCYMLNRRSREMGLGPASVITLADAIRSPISARSTGGMNSTLTRSRTPSDSARASRSLIFGHPNSLGLGNL